MIKSATTAKPACLATIIGIVALIVTATGVFGEVQSAMNAIWKAKPQSARRCAAWCARGWRAWAWSSPAASC